jgi:hypothetical protein
MKVDQVFTGLLGLMLLCADSDHQEEEDISVQRSFARIHQHIFVYVEKIELSNLFVKEKADLRQWVK